MVTATVTSESKPQKGERRNGSRVVRLSASSLKSLNRYSSQPDVAITMMNQSLEESRAMFPGGNLTGFDEKKFLEKLRPIIREECENALQPYVQQ
jgi:hypothetical protein